MDSVADRDGRVIYVVVYGPSHEDFVIYADREKAQRKRAVQASHDQDFAPFVATYTLDDARGIYRQTNTSEG
jgi:hypothetical protein